MKDAPPPPSSPPGAYTQPLLSFVYHPALGANVVTQDGANTIRLVIPPNALPDGTVVTIYKGNPAVLGPLLPGGQRYIDSYAVSWLTPSGTSPDAAAPLTLNVADPAVTPSDSIYVTNRNGAQRTPAAVVTGSWSVSFTTDPGYIAAGPGPGLPRSGALKRGNPLEGLAVLLVTILTVVTFSGIRASGRDYRV